MKRLTISPINKTVGDLSRSDSQLWQREVTHILIMALLRLKLTVALGGFR